MKMFVENAEAGNVMSLGKGKKTRRHVTCFIIQTNMLMILIVPVMLNSVSTSLFDLGSIPSDYMVHFVTDTFQQL